MIGKLVFKLPEESEDFKLAQNGSKYRVILDDIQEYLRRKYKHAEPKSDKAYAEYEQIKDDIYELIGDLDSWD